MKKKKQAGTKQGKTLTVSFSNEQTVALDIKLTSEKRDEQSVGWAERIQTISAREHALPPEQRFQAGDDFDVLRAYALFCVPWFIREADHEDIVQQALVDLHERLDEWVAAVGTMGVSMKLWGRVRAHAKAHSRRNRRYVGLPEELTFAGEVKPLQPLVTDSPLSEVLLNELLELVERHPRSGGKLRRVLEQVCRRVKAKTACQGVGLSRSEFYRLCQWLRELLVKLGVI